MGIPSYFSHIIRNYSNIIRNLKHFNDNDMALHHLFMDCNSIIYDSVRSVEYSNNDIEFEEKVINIIIKQIENYIRKKFAEGNIKEGDSVDVSMNLSSGDGELSHSINETLKIK